MTTPNDQTSLDAEKLLSTCKANEISMCGQLPAAFVIQVLHQLAGEYRSQEIAYDTSAAVSGDTSRVVGYAGVLFV